jgi:glycosyltransferase involved in cell wall biosynthesis
VRQLAERFHSFEKLTPWIALGLLLYIGVGMIVDAVRGGEKKEEELGSGTLLLQGIATSIDALSVGFTIEHYPFSAALAEALIIGTPVLSTDCTGPREILDGGNYGMIVENSDEGLYNVLKRCCDEPALLKEYREKAKLRHDFFDEDRILKQITGLL